MKKILGIFMAALLLFGCKKDSLTTQQDQLIGRWEYVRYIGYPFTATALPPGNGQIIVFLKDGQFEQRKYDTIIFKGKYNLVEKKDCFGDEKLIFVNTIDASFIQNSSIKTAGDSLTINASNCLQDAGTTVYRKL